FTAAYALEACKTTASSAPSPALPGVPCPPLPVVEVARDDVTLGVVDATTEASKPPRWKRLDAYARGLLNALQEDVGDATPVLTEVIALAPEHAEGHIDLARLLIRQGRTAEAMVQLDAAAKIDALTPVIPFLRGI